MDLVIEKGDETRVLAGTPTTGATSLNRLGCATPPEGWDVRAYVLVPAGATSITAADVLPNLWTPEINAAVVRIEASL